MGPAYLPVAASLRRCVHRIGFGKNVDVLAYPVGYRLGYVVMRHAFM